MSDKIATMPTTIRGKNLDPKNRKPEKVDAELAILGIHSAVAMAGFTPSMAVTGERTATLPDPGELFLAMDEFGSKVADQNATDDIERMLVRQMVVLDAMFNHLAIRASTNTTVMHFDLLMKTALKAQAQSRCTAEAIANIKNPRQVAFVKQANIAHGHQQVNNGQETTTTRTRESFSGSAPNELLEVSNGNYLDTGAQGAASRNDPQLATLGKIDRRENTRGKRAGGKKRLEGRASTPDA